MCGYCASPSVYLLTSVASNSPKRFSISPGWPSPRLKSAWNRSCASGHVSAVVKELRASRRQSTDGSETWLTRFFAAAIGRRSKEAIRRASTRSEEHTSELQSRLHLVCRLLLEKKKKRKPEPLNMRQEL